MGQQDEESINLEMTFLTAGTDEASQTPTAKTLLSTSCECRPDGIRPTLIARSGVMEVLSISEMEIRLPRSVSQW